MQFYNFLYQNNKNKKMFSCIESKFKRFKSEFHDEDFILYTIEKYTKANF